MMRTKVVKKGNSQVIRQPKEFQFKGAEVEIFRKNSQLILREKPSNLSRAFTILSRLSDKDCQKVSAVPSSILAQKGQLTIPSEIRQFLGLRAGDRVGFIVEDGRVLLIQLHYQIEAAFGLCQPKKSSSSKNMKQAVRRRGKHESD